MAKFVEWANSLLGRFEEQVILILFKESECLENFQQSKMSNTRKIDKHLQIFFFPLSCPIALETQAPKRGLT